MDDRLERNKKTAQDFYPLMFNACRLRRRSSGTSALIFCGLDVVEWLAAQPGANQYPGVGE